jgi:hypothetical protein
MTMKLLSGVGAAIGCRILPKRNQLVFVEYAKGAISFLDIIRPLGAIVSQGSTVIKGTWTFNCETGASDASPGADIWWEQMDNIKRQMVPMSGASIVNLGNINFGSVTPITLQAQIYSKIPIPGNNNASNQLINGDVFAVQTDAGNFAKIRVVQYGYDMKIEWVTYKLASPYHLIGSGYTTPEDIAVSSDEMTAYVTERTGNLLRVDLNNANRNAAVVVASGMQAPQQICLDEPHQQAYIVEYANPGKLIRVDLKTGQKTVLLSNLSNAVGLLVSSDLAYAFISEQSPTGRVTQYSLQGGAKVEIASGLNSPFFLTWANQDRTSFFVAERDPANRITLVETVPRVGSVRTVLSNVGARPSSIACIDEARMIVCCDQEIDAANILEGIVPAGLFKGIGLVPLDLIPAGKADTTLQPKYPYQFAKDSPFGGILSLQIDHLRAWFEGARYYRVWVDKSQRFDTWTDLKLNTANGKHEILVEFKPTTIGTEQGLYTIHQPGESYMNKDLGMILNSTSVANGLRTFTIEFFDGVGKPLKPSQTTSKPIQINNSLCIAKLDMPIVAGKSADSKCGMLNYITDQNDLSIVYVASHPSLFATYSFWIVRGANTIHAENGKKVISTQITFLDKVSTMLGGCKIAAFSANLYVYAMSINGYSRQSQYDASSLVAFALVP